MVTVVCLGIAVLDHVLATPELPRAPGKHFATGHLEVGGGPAATAAVTIARLGGRALFWGRLGTDASGDRILGELAGHAVEVDDVRRVPGARSPLSFVVVDSRGERLIVAYADPELDADPSWLPIAKLEAAQAVLADVRWPEGAEALLKAARARGLPAVLDADRSPDNAARGLLPLASHVVFSAPGLEQVAGSADPEVGLRRAAALAPGWLAVTCGEAGCWWLEGSSVRHLPAYAIEVVDTVGAGDVFHGAFALALAEGRGGVEALRFAAAAAALKCRRPGGRAGIPERAEVERLIGEQGQWS